MSLTTMLAILQLHINVSCYVDQIMLTKLIAPGTNFQCQKVVLICIVHFNYLFQQHAFFCGP